MSKDIQVYTSLNAKVQPAESPEILLLSTEGEAAMKTFTDLQDIEADFGGKKVAAMAAKLFNQEHTLADTLIRKVRIAGIENPQAAVGTNSKLTVTFASATFTSALEGQKPYYVKIGGKAIVQVQTDSVPASDLEIAKLFQSKNFTEDGITFEASVSKGVVTFTSTEHTAISGYTETVEFYKNADCTEPCGLQNGTLAVVSGSADVSRADALIAAIEELRDVDDDFYFILTDVTDDECVKALCQWAEGTAPTEAELGAGVEDHRKFYFGQTANKEYANDYGRSAVFYSEAPYTEWADAAWVGCVAPFWPQSVTWKWKVPDGVEVADLRDSERDVLENNRVNFMTEEYKHAYVKNGICGDGNFVDNVLGADYITYQMRENLYRIFMENPKIGYNDGGFALVADSVFDALNRAVDLEIISVDAESGSGNFTVTVPKLADATEEQITNRRMPDIYWEAELDGAIHSAKVSGVLSVTLNS